MSDSAGIVPVLLAFVLAVGAGLWGFELVPDTALYSRSDWHWYPSPIGNVAGSLAGRFGVVLMSGVAAAVCVALMPAGRRRWAFLGLCAYWFAFPGVDALGLVFVLLAWQARRRVGRAAGLALACLAHPVAALVAWPSVFSRGLWGRIGVAVMAIAAIVGVGLYDGWTTTDRYVLPLVALALGGGSRVG